MFRVRPGAALTAAALTAVLFVPKSHAISGGGGKEKEESASVQETPEDEATAAYTRGMELVKEGRYQEALDRFRSAVKHDKKNPEYLNMMAYTLRKTGNIDDAFETYAKALSLKPKFPQAREYLGEAHLQALLLELDVLRGYGPDGKREYDLLVSALQEAAKTLEAEPMGGPTPVPDKKTW